MCIAKQANVTSTLSQMDLTNTNPLSERMSCARACVCVYFCV